MAKSDSFHEYVMEEVFGEISGVTSRAMFGGWGIYKDGLFFALIADGELYFRVDNKNRKDYEGASSKPFVYTGHKGKQITMSYWLLPADVMEETEQLKTWVEKSVVVAKRAKKK